MLVPGKKNNGEKQEDKNKKIIMYSAIGVGALILIVGIVFLFKVLVLSPGNEEDLSETEIDKILSSVKKDDDSPVYGGLTESEKKLRKAFEQSNSDVDINKNQIIENKEKSSDIAMKTPEKAPEKPLPVKTEEVKKVNKPVNQEPPKPVKTAQKNTGEVIFSKTKDTSSGAKFTIQIAAFRTPESGQKELKNLLNRRFDAELLEVDLGAKGRWYRLRTGKYKTKEEASAELWKLGTIGIKNAIVTPY